MTSGWSEDDGKWFCRALPRLSLRNEQVVIECSQFTGVRLGSKDNTLRWRFAWSQAEKVVELPVAQVRNAGWWPEIFDFYPPDEQWRLCWCSAGRKAEKGHTHEVTDPELREAADDLQSLLIACRGFDAGHAFDPAEPDWGACDEVSSAT